jgi:hypothetical protein
MSLARRRLTAWLVALTIAAFAQAGPRAAHAYVDINANRIDDRIEAVHDNGWSWAFVNQDVTRRMRIGVENPAAVVFAIYVRLDHKPTAADPSLLRTTGVTMAWPFMSVDYIESRASWAQINAIRALPGVVRIEAVPVDYVSNHYGSRVVRARDSRGLSAAENNVLFPSVRGHLGFDGNGIVIGILDTGVNDETDMVNPGYPGHEGLKGKFLGGGEFWCGQEACATPANGSSNPQDHGGEASSYHATHCAGIAMGTGGPGGFFAGVAPGARLVDCKVLSDAGASVGGSERGLDWCIANKNTLWPGLLPGSIWQGIDVVSMSLGSTECKTGDVSDGTGASNDIVNAAVDAGLVVVIATGNDDSTDCIASPAAADKSIAVGASAHYRTLERSDDKVTAFSNEGMRDDDGDADHFDEYKPSVVAPGAGIISASGDPTTDGTAYAQLSGTSMACPSVAGCAALVLQANGALTPLQVRSILQNTAEHNVPTEKASGDRGQDPYGIDANYDPGCGWGLVDVYAAAKEALNSTSGVQVVQERAIAQPALGRIDFKWITQREYPSLGFNVYRALDVAGAPGAFVKLNPLPVAPAGDPLIQGDDNRQPYTFADADPALAIGQQYWYRVDWVDLLGVAHAEPPVSVAYGELARIATAFYSVVHNAVDNDLLVRVGSDHDYSPGNLGNADYETLGPGESSQDSARVVLPSTVPANTGTSTVGTIEHFWSVGFKQGDGAQAHLPPSMTHPWFLSVKDAGYVNRTGRVTSFSLFVNDSPGSASGSTYVTNHTPMPQPTGEFGLAPALLWIPESAPTATVVARFQGDATANGIRLVLELTLDAAGVTATVFRGTSDDFDAREVLTASPVAFAGRRLEYLDPSVRAGTAYSYWVQIHEPDGTSFLNGPVTVTTGGGTSISFAAVPRPNPVRGSTTFEYVVGSDVAGSSHADVSLRLHDLQGRLVRTIQATRLPSGRYSAQWDTRDNHGQQVGAGTYYLLFTAGTFEQTRRVTVVR